MLSDEMLKQYEETYEKFTELFSNSDFYVRHRSLKKYENNSNRDLLIFHLDENVCGIYVGKKGYKIWMRNEDWYTHTKRTPTKKDDKGYYSIMCESLSDCIDEIKSFVKRAYDFN